MIRHISAIFIKQMKDLKKNKMIMLLMLMFPILSLLFNRIASEQEFLAILPTFLTMNGVLLPIIFTSSIVSEEKEKNSLRMLIMSNVKSWEYLIGVGLSVFFQTFLSSLLFIPVLNKDVHNLASIYCAMAIGIIFSFLIGAILAVICKNQMSAGPSSAPISLVLGMAPMFSQMNEEIEKYAKYLYSYYTFYMFSDKEFQINNDGFIILTVNLFVLLFVFIILYNKKGIK